MVNDTRIQELIGWSSGGNRFCVYDTRQFAKTVLPQYFRHNNWTSFVRQLN
ncbi:HSF-type DNA-binding-domain-containing protein, partial [Chlamydoabsidia padenii]